jgi:hypothetical protein
MLETAIASTGVLLAAVTAWFTWRMGRAAGRTRMRTSLRVGASLRVYIAQELEVVVHDDGGSKPAPKKLDPRLHSGLGVRSRLRGVRRVVTSQRAPRTDLPGWAFLVLRHEDAERYRKEWGAHLWELIEAGELKQARRDRRRLIGVIFWLALAIRVHRVLTRARVR